MISPRLLWEGLVTGDPWMGGAWRGCHACGQPFREDGWPSSPRCPSCEPVRLPIMPVAACHRWTVSRPTFSSQLPVEYEAIPLDGGCIICGRQAPINRRGQCHWCWSEHSGWAPPEDLLAGPQIGPKRNEETTRRAVRQLMTETDDVVIDGRWKPKPPLAAGIYHRPTPRIEPPRARPWRRYRYEAARTASQPSRQWCGAALSGLSASPGAPARPGVS